MRCNNWDSRQPELVFDDDGHYFGILMPRASAAVLAASPGIQNWSKPADDERDPGVEIDAAEYQLTDR